MRNLKNNTLAMLLIAAMLGVTTSAIAQRGSGQGYGKASVAGTGYYCNNIPNLTEEQQAKLETLRTTHWKDAQNNRNLIAEKSAKLNTLRSADNADMKAINKTIDEMSSLRSTMQKSREQHIQDIRSVLTDEQRVYFDSSKKGGKGKGRCGRGNGQGRMNGNGYGKGNGAGRGLGPCSRI